MSKVIKKIKKMFIILNKINDNAYDNEQNEKNWKEKNKIKKILKNFRFKIFKISKEFFSKNFSKELPAAYIYRGI